MTDIRVLLCVAVLLAFFGTSASSLAASSEYSMTLGVGEEYNSNVNDTNNGKSDWISKMTAVGSFNYSGPRVSVGGAINGSYNVYALGNRNDEFKGGANLNAKVALADELLFVEANGNFQQVYQNLIRGETNPTDSTRGQVNQYTTTGKVYFTPHFSDRLSVRIGYDCTAYLYGDDQGTRSTTTLTGASSTTNKFIHVLYLSTAYELTPVFQITFDANALKNDSSNGSTDQAYVNAGFKWQYSEDGMMYAKVGPRISKYSNGASTLNPYVDASISQRFGRLSATASLGSQYAENPASTYPSLQNRVGMELAWNAERLSLQARGSYSLTDGEDTQKSNQLALGLTAMYKLTPRLAVSAGASTNTTQTSNSFQVRWYANGGLTYELGKNFSLEGYYRWKISGATQGANTNNSVSIVGLSLRKTF